MPISKDYKIVETLHENSCTVVQRAIRLKDKKKVILKSLKPEARGENTIAEFANEQKILKKIRSKNITKLLSTLSTPSLYIHIFEDIGAQSLFELINTKDFTLLQKLHIAYALAVALKSLHQKNIIHVDINPKNIIYNEQTQAIQLIDFGQSIINSTQHSNTPGHKGASANLFYISPEQTGLTKNKIDFRSDLYSLGMSLYHLFLGYSPYNANDKYELMHKQIASTPEPLNKINSDIPLVISEIISKLIEKKPDERYQNTDALFQDLQECLKRSSKDKEIKHFTIAQHNHPILDIGSKLFGRETELSSIKKLIQDSFHKTDVNILVSGHSGVGKTRLAEECLNYFDENSVNIINSKFEQFNIPLPYASFKQLFSQLFTLLMSQLNTNKLLTLSAKSSSILLFIFPELSPLFTKNKTQFLNSHEDLYTQLSQAIKEFFALIATEDKALVIFIDDLQWADEASSRLILEALLKSSNPFVHFIASYRDNEIKQNSHALELIDYFNAQSSVNYLALTLQSLNTKQFNEMLTTLLEQSNKSVQELTDILYKKTDGNPFYIKSLLQFLIQEKELQFTKRKWVFSLDNIKKYSAALNIVELLSSKFSKLNSAQSSFLQYLSLLGSTYDLEMTLAMMQAFGYKEDLLEEVEAKGFIEQSSHNYNFVHDQIQQNIYASLDEKRKQSLHLKIANYLDRAFKKGEYHDSVNLAYHFNNAYAPSNFPKRVFTLNLLALESLIENNAYNSALQTVAWIQTHLYDETLWQKQTPECFKYNYLKTKVFYLNAQTKTAYEEIIRLLPYAKNIPQKLLCFTLLKNISVTLGQNFEALIDFGNELLFSLGLEVPYTQKALKSRLHSLEQSITSHPLHKSPNEILKLKTLSNTNKQHIVTLLIDYWEAAYYLTDLNKMQWASLSIIDISFHFGNSSESSFAYALYGAQLASQKEYKTSALFGEVALKLNHKFDDKIMLPKVHNFVANFINSYKNSFASNITLYQKSLYQSKLNGDIVFGIWANFLMHFSDYLSGESLTNLRENISKESDFILDSGDEKMISIFNVLSHHVDYLQDLSAEDIQYEQKALSLWKKEGFYPAVVWYAIVNAQHCFILGNFDEGLSCLDTHVNSTENEVIMFPKIRLHIIRILLTLAKEGPLSELQSKHLALDLEELNDFQKANPKKFKFAKLLIQAESTKNAASMWDVAKMYDASLTEAKKSNNPFLTSIASLCAGRFFKKLSFNDLTTFYFNEAIVALNQWGAYTYSNILKQTLFQEDEGLTKPLVHSSHHSNTVTSVTKVEQTNWDSLITSFNAISLSNNNEALIKTLMKVILQNATASKAILVLKEGDSYKVRSEIDFESASITSHNTFLDDAKNIPINMLAYAINTTDSLLVTSPSESGKFQFDPYFKKIKAASCLVIPSIIEGSVTALLYLENKELVTPLHTDTIKTLELLLTQAAIVFKNTSLLETLKESEHKLTQAQKLSKVGSWQFNSQTEEITWSAEAYRIYNLEPFSISINGEWFFEHIPFEDLDYVSQAAEKSLNGESNYDVIHRIFTADDKIKFVHQRAEVIMENGVKVLSGTIQDITESQESKEKILRLSQVVEQSPYATIITDFQGHITYANQHTFEMTGYTREELLGNKMNIFRSYIHSDSFYEKMWHTIKEKKEIWKGTLINTMKNSEKIDCQSTIFPILNEKKEIINFVTIQEDVTQRNIKDKLFLMQTRQAQMGEMLSMIAHQWRQPLSVINALINTQRINILLEKYETQELIQSFDDVETQVSHLSSTITDFRDFFKPDKKPVKTKSSTIISKVTDLIQQSLDQQNVKLDVAYKEDPGYMSFEHELEQVILNLFKNAQDAFAEHNIKEPHIKITCSKIKDEAVIEFEDNAKGIDKEIIDTLFLPYISTKDQKHGTGLGLYMSKTIVEEHCKGKIDVHNTKTGACFQIALPLKDTHG